MTPESKRLGTFGRGVALGFVGPLVGIAILYGITFAPGSRREPFSVSVSSSGVDASASGARRLFFEHHRSRIQQICNGGCDDLQLQEDLPETGYRVRILDGAGRCLACTDDLYVDRGYGSPVLELTVAGASPLDIRAAYGAGLPSQSVVVRPARRAEAPAT